MLSHHEFHGLKSAGERIKHKAEDFECENAEQRLIFWLAEDNRSVHLQAVVTDAAL